MLVGVLLAGQSRRSSIQEDFQHQQCLELEVGFRMGVRLYCHVLGGFELTSCQSDGDTVVVVVSRALPPEYTNAMLSTRSTLFLGGGRGGIVYAVLFDPRLTY